MCKHNGGGAELRPRREGLGGHCKVRRCRDEKILWQPMDRTSWQTRQPTVKERVEGRFLRFPLGCEHKRMGGLVRSIWEENVSWDMLASGFVCRTSSGS